VCVECGRDLARLGDQRRAGQPRRDEVRVLIHREHRHPVRRGIGESEATVGVADSIGERPTTRNDQKRVRWRSGLQGCEHRFENVRRREDTAAELYDGFDERRRLRPGHVPLYVAVHTGGASLLYCRAVARTRRTR